MSPQIAVEAAAHARVGRRRSPSGDGLGAMPSLGLFVVADGLTRCASWDGASRVAIEVIQRRSEQESDTDSDPDDASPYGTPGPRDREEVRLMLCARRTDRSIDEPSRHQEHQEKTRCKARIFTGVLLAPGVVYLAHTGGARLYRMRGGTLKRLTQDHALIEELLNEGDGAREALEALSEQANAVARALGCDSNVDLTSRVETTLPGDIFLIASDGLWSSVPERRIAGVLGAHEDLRLAAGLLIELANERGGSDKITCVLARVGDG